MPLGEKKQTQRKWKAIFGFFLIAFVLVAPFLSRNVALAAAEDPAVQIRLSLEKAIAACPKTGPMVTVCPQEAIAKVAATTSDEVIKPTWDIIGSTALLNLASFIFDRLAYEGAVYIVSGGKGQTPLIESKSATEAWKSFGLDIAGEAVGALSEGINKMSDNEFGKKFNLCKPSVNLSFSLALGIQQTYKPRPPKCDLTKFSIEGFEGLKRFYASDGSGLSTSNMMREVAGFMRPGQNELSLAVDLNAKVLDEVMEKKKVEFEKLTSSGFFRDATNLVTGKTKKPADVIKEEYKLSVVQNVQNKNKGQMEGLYTVDWGKAGLGLLAEIGGIFANTLLSKGTERLVQEFLSSAIPDADPFASFEATNQPGRAEAIQRLSKITAINPISPTNYNALGEFSVCPVGNIMSRGPNNCVIDSQFIQALTNTQSDVPITLQQALKDGKIKDLPLISDQDKARNQDPLCYTYGYCYGNLVKLRKARVIPVGWEMAAQLNNVDNPAKLSDIMKRFDNCNAQGEWENTDNYRFCHLIDPNWVLKYPESQCRAMVNGELLATTSGGGRAVVCADTPSCVAEDDKGECTGGFGYCVKEKNVWRFRGDACPEQFASCLSFRNTFNGKTGNWLLNTVDYGVCGKDNAGCRWYKTTKEMATDGSYQWTASTLPISSAVGVVEDRIYFNNDVKQCGASDAGCTKVIPATTARLNLIANPSFEKVTSDGKLEFWSGNPAAINATGSAHGSKDVVADTVLDGLGQGFGQGPILLSPNAFYTLSFYARMGEGSVSSEPEEQGIAISFTSLDGIRVGLGGTSISSSCRIVDQESVSLNDYIFLPTRSVSQEFQRYACTFTTLGKSLNANISFYPGDGELRFDAIQLEAGESATAFAEGYGNTTPKGTHLRLPPEYLKCDGTEMQPKECKNFTQACQAQDVGCNLYTPDDGDPEIPAVISVTDRCPAACVGYATYKQEPSFYENPSTPVYANFIATRATSCQQQNVGCDGFTNLDTVARGGEGKETYTYLRACTKPNDPNAPEAVFYTWEGNDQQGYQLKTWRLLKSNASGQIIYSEAHDSIVVSPDVEPSSAPCTKWQMDSTTTLTCNDNGTVRVSDQDVPHITILAQDDSCNEHDDVLNSADGDCREFYDAAGNIHYRRFLQTVTVSESCQPYRKNASAKDDCEYTGGKWNIATGECRYLGLASESYQCPSAADGCRAYTGGAGRNSQTVYSQGFEPDETPMVVEADNNAKPIVSSEAITAGKHSLRLEVSGQYLGFEQAHRKLSSVCNDEEGCDGGEGVGACKIKKGKTTCGELDGKILPGKSYTVEFLAKATGGSGKIRVAMVDGANVKHDLVNAKSVKTDIAEFADLQLNAGWRPFKLGPIETSAFAEQADSVGLRFVSAEGGSGQIFYFDEITIRQVDEHIAIVKNSWSVPTVCDQTPDGTASPQYYLGCEAYTNKQGSRLSLYQFSRLCSEDVIGCQRFYDTRGSDSAYGKAFNVTCEATATATVLTPCKIDSGGPTYCTISPGKKSCQFNLPNNDIPQFLPSVFPISGNGFTLKLGPETVLVSNDIPKYFVDNGTTTCAEEVAGCTEFGVPTYSQDKEKVTAFASTYFINDVDKYAPEDGTPGTLCKDEELFCDEWSTTKNGNYYFKDPVDKACEYKTGVRIDDQTYYGWFKKGTSLACYANAIVAGERYDIKRNGDDLYEGWAGQCGAEANMCTGFVDPTDTQNGRQPFGKTYTFLDNDALRDATDDANATEPCEGLASQKAGCALFNNTSVSRLTFAAGPTYTLSNHADKLIDGGKLFMKVDPVDCAKPVAERSAKGVDLCARRCRYDVGTDRNNIVDGERSEDVPNSSQFEFGKSCYEDKDCPTLHDEKKNSINGSCVDINLSTKAGLAFSNDTNSVLKVNRDRTCSEWNNCASAQLNWNERTNRYEYICQQIGLCDLPGGIGDLTSCGRSARSEPVTLTVAQYADRDVSWTGKEYSGYSIPNQYPLEQLTQVGIKPDSTCENGRCKDSDKVCVSNADCIQKVTKLVHEIGPCDQFGLCTDGKCSNTGVACTSQAECKITDGTKCTIGICKNTGKSCGFDSDCGGVANSCTFGICRGSYPTVGESSIGKCQSNKDANDNQIADDCENVANTSADYSICDVLTKSCVKQGNACSTIGADCGGGMKCQPAEYVKEGSCFENKCLQDKDGSILVQTSAEGLTCRGFPETDSPFPSKIVKMWAGFKNDGSRATDDEIPPGKSAEPSVWKNGYENSKTCAPVCDSNGCRWSNECLCSYDKVQYGGGGAYRYYEDGGGGAKNGIIPEGICSGGEWAGKECSNDSQCRTGDASSGSFGICQKVTGKETKLGWEGFCLERDQSINLYGSQSAGDNPCLTWLPIDQPMGSTDLYGKFTDAGFPLEDAYYCTEAGYYADLYPTGTYFNQYGGLQTDKPLEYACAVGDSTCDGDEDDINICATNVRCPKGYVGVLAACIDDGDDIEDSNHKKLCGSEFIESNGMRPWLDQGFSTVADDCPYFCLPEKSNHIVKNDRSQKSCVTDLIQNFSPRKIDKETRFGSHWVKTDVYYVGKASVFNDEFLKTFNDCAVRGIPVGESSEYGVAWKDNSESDTTWSQETMPHVSGYGQHIENSKQNEGRFVVSEGNSSLGFYNLAFVPFGYLGFTSVASMQEYIGCYEVTQAASSDKPTDVNRYSNKAWTNRLLVTPSTFALNTNKTDVNPSGLLASGTVPAVAGKALLMENYDFENDKFKNKNWGGIDSWPLPVASCVALPASITPQKFCSFGYGGPRSNTSCSGDENCVDILGCIMSTNKCGSNSSISCASNSNCNGRCVEYPTEQLFKGAGLYTTLGGSDATVCKEGDLRSQYPTNQQYVPPTGGDAELGGEGAFPNSLARVYENIPATGENPKGEVSAFTGKAKNDEFGDSVSVGNKASSGVSVHQRLSQFFAKTFNSFEFKNEDGGKYVEPTKEIKKLEIYGDNPLQNDEFGKSSVDQLLPVEKRPPMIVPIGKMDSGKAFEAQSGGEEVSGFNVNGDWKDGVKNITGKGRLHAVVSFFVYARPNQLPLRNIVVDWGDGNFLNSDANWPNDSFSGSKAPDNFYKNHRGWEKDADGKEIKICDQGTEWGKTSASCDPSYRTYSHDYTCDWVTVRQLAAERVCEVDDTSDDKLRLINSPCTGTAGGRIPGGDSKCVYQPRVHAKDNWGYCTGVCKAGETDNSPVCYDDGSESGVNGSKNECDIESFPGRYKFGSLTEIKGTDLGTNIVNPWINHNGFIIVEP